jgi:hypothetical protein
VAPGRQGADEQDDQDDNQDNSHDFPPLLFFILIEKHNLGDKALGSRAQRAYPSRLHPFVMHWKGWKLAVRTALLAGAFLTALALTDTLARCSAFTFTTASTIGRPFRPSWGAFSISSRHPNHLLSQKCTTVYWTATGVRRNASCFARYGIGV